MSKAERTRRFIIEQSAPIFNKKGMAGTSMTDIMEATKLAKGGIYGNFESKDEICLEAFSYLSDYMATQLDQAMSKEKTARGKLHALLEAYRGARMVEGGCPILNFGMEADDTHPVMKAQVRKAITRSQARIFAIFSEGIAQQEFTADLDARVFSIKTFAMIEGAILCKRVMGDEEQMKVIFDAIRKDLDRYLS